MRILSLLLAASLAQASQARPVEILYLIDSSHSMSSDLGGTPRLDAVKQVLRREIPALPAGIKGGLATFGHRSNTDCRDAEVVVKPGGEDRDALVRETELLLPIGKRLTARGIETACVELHRQEALTVVLFIGAGGDECGGTPCASVKALVARGLNLEFHAIGLAPAAADEADLKCAAEAGQGTYTRANNAEELGAAVKAVQARIPAMVRNQPPAAAGQGWLHITFDAAALPALGRVDLTDLGTGAVVKSMNNPAPAAVHNLPPGRYGIGFTYLSLEGKPPVALAAGEFEVKEREHTEVRFGMLKIELKNRPALAALKGFRIVPSGREQPVLTLDPALALVPRPLPVGTYDIWLDYADARPPVRLAEASPFGRNGGLIIELDGLLKKEPKTP